MAGRITGTPLDPNFKRAFSGATPTPAPGQSPEAKQAEITRRAEMYELTSIEATLRDYMSRAEYRAFEEQAYQPETGKRGQAPRSLVLERFRAKLAEINALTADQDDPDYSGSAEYSELPY